jgi:hypothetical protein
VAPATIAVAHWVAAFLVGTLRPIGRILAGVLAACWFGGIGHALSDGTLWARDGPVPRGLVAACGVWLGAAFWLLVARAERLFEPSYRDVAKASPDVAPRTMRSPFFWGPALLLAVALVLEYAA